MSFQDNEVIWVGPSWPKRPLRASASNKGTSRPKRERWRFSASDRQMDIVTHWAPDGAENKMSTGIRNVANVDNPVELINFNTGFVL